MLPIGAVAGAAGGMSGGPSNTESTAASGGNPIRFGNINYGGTMSDGLKYALIGAVAFGAFLYFKSKGR